MWTLAQTSTGVGHGDWERVDRRVSSHSLKCTMLSYAAKRGISVPDRLMLGYHSSNMHMAMVYSRDGAAASLLLLERLIDEIVKGTFKPDSTRSGRIVESQAQGARAWPSKRFCESRDCHII